MDRPYKAALWNDGEYVAGSGGERNPIVTVNHAANATAVEGNIQGPGVPVTITAAPGESFADSLTTSTPLAGYDPTKGVAIRNPNTSSPMAGPGQLGGSNAGILAWEFGTNISRIQMQAPFGPGLYGFNSNIFTDNIIDGGYLNVANSTCVNIWMDNIGILVNNLILNHGCIAIGIKYGNIFVGYNTIVNVGSVTAPVAIVYMWSWVFQDVAIFNNAISGFTHVVGENREFGTSPINAASIGNVTTTTGPDTTGTTWWRPTQPNQSVVVAAVGTTFGVSAASMFVSPGTDYRPNTALTSSGAAFGAFSVNCWTGLGGCVPFMQTWDTPDILGNARPNGSSQVSTGAEQHP
jgi:hypothetical protein